MPTYKFTYTQQIVITRKEYERVGKLLESKHRIIIINDVDGNKHLLDWQYVTDNKLDEIRPDKPNSLPG